jgi:hypothetical protein
MTTSAPNPKGFFRLSVRGQVGLPKQQQKLLQKALDEGKGADNELRFQCRIAQDVNAAFERLDLGDGTYFTIHEKSKAQFGRDRNGEAYLTVVAYWSKNNTSYRIKWTGDAVPRRAKVIAVAHDEGRKVAPERVAFRWSAASITKVRHDLAANGEMRDRTPSPGGTGKKRTRKFDRLCAADL